MVKIEDKDLNGSGDNIDIVFLTLSLTGTKSKNLKYNGEDFLI